MTYNPSDNSAGTNSGTCLFEVIDNVDPNGTGRILVRPVGDAEGFKDPKECQWIPVSTPYFAQLRGIGVSPPHSYEKGSMIIGQHTGQQGWIATSAVPNTLKSDEKGDTHPESRSKEHKHSSRTGQAKTGNRKNESYSIGSQFPNFDELQASFKHARNFYTGKAIEHFKGKFKEAVNKQQTKNTYLNRMKNRNGEVQNPISTFLFKGDESATEFMQQVQSPPILDSTFDMLKTLKETARNGKNIVANLSVNGWTNINAARSAASAARSAVQSENAQNAIDPFEEWLRQLYRSLTSLEPLENGAETVLYTLFKEFYLLAVELNLEDEYIAAIQVAVAAGSFVTFMTNFDLEQLEELEVG